MWISKRRFQGMERRIEFLEDQVSNGRVWYVYNDKDEECRYGPFGKMYENRITMNDFFNLLLDHLNLRIRHVRMEEVIKLVRRL